MSRFLLEAAIALFVVLFVMAFKYRSTRAREILILLRNALWIYIAVVVVLAIGQVALQLT
jgi:hypothetical protein